MWSMTQKALENRLADCLKERVYYSYAVYDTFKHNKVPCWGSEFRVFYIRVDGETWLASDPDFFTHRSEYIAKGYTDYDAEMKAIKTYGKVETGFSINNSSYDVMTFIHEYLNILNFEGSFYNDNYFIRLLAVLDRRLGKRKLKALVDKIDNEPEWFRRWVRLRAETEGFLS